MIDQDIWQPFFSFICTWWWCLGVKTCSILYKQIFL